MNLLLAQPETTTNPGPPNPLLCSAGQLEIIDFNGEKAFKVVVGLPITIRGMHSPLENPYSWQLGHGDLTHFAPYWPLSPPPLALTGQTTIPTSALPVNNSDFGETHGIIKLSSNANATTLSTKKVQVFFNKDEYNIHDNSVPNWFYYWKQIINLKLISQLLFDPQLEDYGSTDPLNRITKISQQASENNDETDDDGIHAFFETIEHENHHNVIWDEIWPNGYDPALDTDNDFYRDYWEDLSSAGIAYGFHSNDNSDEYGNEFGSGYMYEEDNCRNLEHLISSIKTLYDLEDWSYDPNLIYQGKQWK